MSVVPPTVRMAGHAHRHRTQPVRGTTQQPSHDQSRLPTYLGTADTSGEVSGAGVAAPIRNSDDVPVGSTAADHVLWRYIKCEQQGGTSRGSGESREV